MESDLFDKAYNDYFGINTKVQNAPFNENESIDDVVISGINKNYKKNNQNIGKDNESNSSIDNERLIADGFAFNIHDACDEIRKLLNVILGQGWGDFAPEQSGHLDVNSIPLPSIRYSVNLREVSQNYGPKPKLLDSQKEYANGVETGDAFDIYKHSFDYIVEFNIRDKTSRDCAVMVDKFEEILAMHTGLLKKKGISEMYFLKEVPSKYSLYFTETIPSTTLYYYIRLERTYIIKHSTLKDLELKMSYNGENSDNYIYQGDTIL